MGRKAVCSREDVLHTVIDLLRQGTEESAITARFLAQKMGISTAPLFTLFPGKDAMMEEVKKLAISIYRGYTEKGRQAKHLKIKNFAMEFVRFAKEEPGLYTLLFATKRIPKSLDEFYIDDGQYANPIINELEEKYHIEHDLACEIHHIFGVTVFGLASLCGIHRVIISEKEIESILTAELDALFKCHNLPLPDPVE